MTLQKEIPKRDTENHLSVMSVITPQKIKIIDATLTMKDHQENLDKLCDTLHDNFLPMCIETDRKKRIERERREIEDQKKLAINNAQREAEDTPCNNFTKALKLRNHSLEPLDEWATSTTPKQRLEALSEFKTLAARRGLTLSKEDTDFGLAYLYAHVSQTPTPAPPPPSLIERFKQTVGM